MAKATAICTCKKCGATFEKTTVKRNRREADSWEEWAVNTFDTCPECEHEENAKRAAAIAEEAKVNGLPALIGTPNQVIWAEQLRKSMIELFSKLYDEAKAIIIEDAEENEFGIHKVEYADRAYEYFLRQDKASWWIDRRNDPLNVYFHEQMIRFQREDREKVPESVAAETTITPEEQTKDVAEIILSDNAVVAKYPRDNDFREVVKGCGFRWDADKRCWTMSITSTSGSAVDRAAELSNALLRAGFAVRCSDAEVREKAVNAAFEPRCDRWVMLCVSGEYAGWLCIKYPRGTDELYHAARAIKGARYSHGSIYVPVSNHNLVEDFANLYEFRFSDRAKQAISKFNSQRQSAITAAEPLVPEFQDKLAEILQSSDDIIPDLSDD